MSVTARNGLPEKRLTAVYPGSFDPVTNGHLDLIERASKLFHKVIVAVLPNAAKQPLFDVRERQAMLREAAAPYGNVEVDSFSGLLVDFAESKHASVIVRGLRTFGDYEHELPMTLMNRRLRPQLETVFLMAAEAHAFVSSRMVKEVASLDGDISGLVPPFVEQRLREKLNCKKERS